MLTAGGSSVGKSGGVWLIVRYATMALLMTWNGACTQAQSALADSLKWRLETSTTANDRIEVALELSDHYSGKDPEQSQWFARMVLRDSARSSTEQVIRAYSLVGWAHYDLYQYDSSIIQLKAGLPYAQRLEDKDELLVLYGRISDCYRRLGNFNEAFRSAFEGLELAEHVEAYRHVGNLNNKIGELYREQYETDKAIQHLKSAYLGYQKADRERGMLYAKVNLALAYKQTDAQKALTEYENVLTEFSHLFTSWDSARLFSNLANINMDLDRFDAAEKYLLNALDCHTRIDKPASLAYCYKELGELYVRTGKPELVIQYASRAFDMADQIGYLTLRSQSSKQLSDAHSSLGQFEQSYRFLREYVALQDSIRDMEKIELSNELEAKYENAQKQQQILLQKEQLARQESDMNQEVILRNALIGGVVLLILIGAIIYRNSRLQTRKNQEIRQFADKLQELQATQSRWFTNIAHELRTPLTLILGPIQNLLHLKDMSGRSRSEVQLAKKYGDQLVDRVNEILEISRLESGKLVLHQHPTDMGRLVAQAIASFESLADHKQVALQFIHADKLIMNVDPNKITTIVNNLVSNAIKFAPVGSSISLSINKTKDAILLSVTDRGPGISKEDLPYIFDRFYQASNNDQHHFAGSGVGLTLSQELAKLHGGSIQVESDEDVGSTFTLVLPASLVTQEEVAPPVEVDLSTDVDSDAGSVQAIDDSKKLTLLLVEDHPDMRAYIRDVIKGQYQIEEAANGLEGLAKLEQVNPAIIISDVKMPEMDGLAFARKVKEDERHRLTPFIHLTAHVNETDKLVALRTGVDDYLVKPFDAEELRVRIHNLIANSLERSKALTQDTDSVQPGGLSHDEQTMLSIEEWVKEHLSESAYSVEALAKQVALSVSSLTRLTKRSTGLTPGQFIREIRLQEAIRLLESRQQKTIAEVVYAVGFEDVSSFSRLFKKRFGKSPSAYIKSTLV